MATDFFERQDSARRNTGWLVVFFTAAVVMIIVTVYLVVAGVFLFYDRPEDSSRITRPADVVLWNPQLFVAVSGITTLVIMTGTLFKIVELRAGGSAVAEAVGGRLIQTNTTDPAERRLLNVVEEMAIASGTPVPPVYVLERESSINAFAAGYSPGDAVIGVTNGTVSYLSRDELQGVIAHEFSHVLNGDMRLNIRLIGLLNGILFLAIIGYYLLRGAGRSSGRSDKGKGAAGIALFGLALMIIGYVGVFFGAIIKSAVSRQREYLADASAVQFTRNPLGIANALRKIGGLVAGSRVRHPAAEEVSHMFFGQATSKFLDSLFATHPPLVERIRRLDPSFDGTFPYVTPVEADKESAQGATAAPRPEEHEPIRRRGSAAGPAVIPLAAADAVANVGKPTHNHIQFASTMLARLPEPVWNACHDPFGARALVFALLIEREDAALRQAQLDEVDRCAEGGTGTETRRLVAQLEALGDEVRLPLVEMAVPALRTLSPIQFNNFKDLLTRLVKADDKIDSFEYALVRILLRHLDRQFGRTRPTRPKYHTVQQVREELRTLVTMLAWAGNDEAGAKRAFDAGSQVLGVKSLVLLPRSECGLTQFDAALERLAQSDGQLKKTILDACAACVTADGRIAVPEAELLRAVADAIDCPIPPLVANT
jgi:Zn-dependent protease with chaperone function/uncharacterized tellurite resistance protein B-like protein